MADYYSILGVSRTANDLEIKAAFRRLAKIYHPDKNPNNPEARHVFENVLKAYNTLIHPSSRRRYDQRGSESQSHTQYTSKTQHTKRKHQKEWTFTEEELQRRQYYEKYYKAKQQEKARQQTPPPKAHSDYKYILFATPIAVALFMLIISMFTEKPKTVPLAPKKAAEHVQMLAETHGIDAQLPNGEKPYTGYFGGIKTYNTPNTLGLNNQSGYDAVIVLFDKKSNAYLQNAYVQDSYSIEFHKLPDTGVYWKVMLGKGWDENKLIADKEAIGAFDSIIQFQNWKSDAFIPKDKVTKLYTDIRVAAPDAHKKAISSEADFFEK